MSWVTPRTYVTGEVTTAADLNETRDNLVELHDPPVIHVATTAAVTISTGGSPTVVDFNAEVFKRAFTHSNVSTPSRVTAVTAGVLTLNLNVDWEVNATGRRYADIRKNGTRVQHSNVEPAPGGEASNVVSILNQVIVGDYFDCTVFHDSGGDLDATPNLYVAWLAGSA